MSEKTTREEFDFFIDNPLLGIVYLDKQYRIIRCNMKFEEMFGYKLEEIKSENLDEIIDGDQDMTMTSQNGESIHGSGKRKKKDGTIIEVEIYGIPKISGKTIIGTLGIYLDITERKLAEETIVKSQHELEERVKERTAELTRVNKQLQEEIVVREQTQKKLIESEDKYRTYIEHANDGIYVIHKGKLTFVNSRLAEIMGYKVDELVGKDFLQFIPKSKLNQITDNLKRRLAGEDIPQVYESRILHKDGSEIDVEFNITTIESNDEPATLTIIREITERKQAEEALRKSEEKYKAIFSNAQVALFRTRISDGKLVEINERYAHMAGYSNIEGCMAEFNAADAWADPDARNELVRILKEKGSINDYETEIIRRDGSPLWILFSATIFPEQGFLEGSIVDINEHKQADEALEDSKTLLVQTGRMAKIGGWILDAKTLEVTWTEETYRIHEVPLGHKPPLEEAINFFHSDDRPKLETAIKKALEHGEPYDMEVRFITANGKRLWTHAICKPIIEEGKTVKLTGTFQDITERKQIEHALRESENELRLITENTRDLIAITAFDMKATFLYASPSHEKILGYSPDELIGTSAMEFIHPEDKKKLLPLIKKYVFGKAKQLVTGKQEDIFELLEYRLPQKSGGWHHMEATATLIGGKVIFISRDVTDHIEAEEEKARLEAKLQQAKKMESMGLLAGGVAHDLNNVLSGIVSYPELLLLDLPEDSKLRKPIEVIQESGHRATAIVQDLLTVARGVATAKEPLNLNALVGDYLDSPEFNKLEQFHPTFTVKTNLDKDIFNIIGSPVHIRKVVMNLVSNASEAIEGSGNVTISTMNRYVDRPLRGYDDINIGEYAVLTVSDDGSGISSDDLERIFEPFYTKKVMGMSGTGLGLAVVWNVIQDHKGYIDVRSDGNGTTFEMYFPITRDEVSDGGLSIPIEDYKGDGEAILVVDDVKNQRDISCKMLETLGYNAKAVSSGEEAAEYLKENAADLILLDMIMDPGINGHETYERIVTIHPEQKAVIASGFSESDEVKAAQKLGAGRYIKKPFTLEKIGLAVKEELEKE